MVMDRPPEHLSPEDWRMIGGGEPTVGRGGLPVRRLDVPLPDHVAGLFVLANRMIELGNQMQRLAREGTMVKDVVHPRTFVGQAIRQLELSGLTLKDLRKDWERELRERESSSTESSEQLRVIAGTDKTG